MHWNCYGISKIFNVIYVICKRAWNTNLPLTSLTYLCRTFPENRANIEANCHNNRSKQPMHSRSLPAAIYFGDSEVKAGDPFAITCRIDVDEPVQWIKDGQVLVANAHRHGHAAHDDFVFSESEDEGWFICCNDECSNGAYGDAGLAVLP